MAHSHRNKGRWTTTFFWESSRSHHILQALYPLLLCAAAKRLTSVGTDIEVFREWIPTVLHHRKQKKADVAEHPEAFDHVGLLFNEPPGRTGLFFI